MADLERIYLRSPIPAQNLACSLVGLHTRYTRYDAHFRRFLEQAEARSFWDEEQTIDYRNRRLASFVRHCGTTVPFYRQLFRELGVAPEDIRTLDDLEHLPIVGKREMQDQHDRFVSDVGPPKRRTLHTSGTTGSGLHFVTTLRSIQQQWAVWWRYRRWHGIEQSTWCGYFGGRSVVPAAQAGPPFWRINRPGRQVLFSGYHMSSQHLAAYVDELRRRRPLWLNGYPSLLSLVAAYLIDTNSDLGYAVKWITTGSENLLPAQSDLIYRAFGVRAIQHYGLSEAVANVSECPNGKLHVDEDFAAVEFVPNPSGHGFKVIGTAFTNPATGFLRYDAGDLVNLDPSVACPCGRPGRLVSDLDGRKEDYVILKNGARIGRLDHIFKDLVNVREAQFVQQRIGEVTIRVVKRAEYTDADHHDLLRETRKRLGDGADVTVDYVEHLPRTPTGKLRFVVSELPEASIVG